uniref:Uncharacterized LOC103036371 n=1 Tax=Astyanax mexicanus TaxID=7994 RepID=W5KSI4_ASTMX
MAGLFVLVSLILSTPACLSQSSGSENQPKASGLWQTLQSVSTSLCEDGHGFLVSLFGRQSVDSGLKTLREITTWALESTAGSLNILASYVTEVLGAAGITANLPVKRITPEGVAFVTKWVLLAVLVYWILSLAVCFVSGIVQRTLWLVKITVAIAMFGLILSDTGATAETTAMRLAGLMLACILLGIGPSPFKGDTNTHMEVKVKVLERKVRELEKKSKDD